MEDMVMLRNSTAVRAKPAAEVERVGRNHRIPGNLVKADAETKIYQALHDVRAGEPCPDEFDNHPRAEWLYHCILASKVGGSLELLGYLAALAAAAESSLWSSGVVGWCFPNTVFSRMGPGFPNWFHRHPPVKFRTLQAASAPKPARTRRHMDLAGPYLQQCRRKSL